MFFFGCSCVLLHVPCSALSRPRPANVRSIAVVKMCGAGIFIGQTISGALPDLLLVRKAKVVRFRF